MATQLVADSKGVVRGKFAVPEGIPSGTKLAAVYGSDGMFGQATFTGQGTLERQTWQQQTTVTETRWQSPPPPPPAPPFAAAIGGVGLPGAAELDAMFGTGGSGGFMWRGEGENLRLEFAGQPFPPRDSGGGDGNGGSDPLAQTFSLNRNTQAAAIDLWFTVAPTTTTRVQIRGTTAGVPNGNIFSEAIVQPWQIVTPPEVSGGTATFALSGAGNLVIPAGITTVAVTGHGTGGVAAVAGVAPTFGSWGYAGVSPTNAVAGTLTLPFTTGAAPASFSLTASWIEGAAAITFTKVDVSETSSFAEYKGVHPVTSNPITIHASRITLTSGTTEIAAQPGQAATFTLNGNSYTFPGSASGVSATPVSTTQTIALPGTSPMTLAYTLPDAAVMSASYSSILGATGSASRITFPSPVLLLSGVEYAIVVLCDDADGALSVAELGKFDAEAQRWITSQPYTVGVLLSSSNAITWTPHQDRDLAFRLLAASYTASARTIDLGLATVDNATDLLLMSYAERPASATGVAYLLTLPDSSVVTVADGQPVQLPSAITGDVLVSAVLSGTNSMAPVLFPGTQLVSGQVSESANYITRAVPAGTAVTIKVIYDALVPSGAGVTVTYKGIDGADTWAAVTLGSTRSVDDGFVEFTHIVTGVTETAIQAQLVLTGTTAARPRVRDLRVIVL